MTSHKRFIACEASLEDSEQEDEDLLHMNGYLSKRIKLEVEDDFSRDINGDTNLSDNEFMPSMEDEITPISTIENDIDTSNEEQNIYMVHMDIREPLSTLKTLLEQKLSTKLKEYSFRLQDSQPLESHKNLVDQCVQGEGLVQVNVQLKVNESGEKIINIVDVLKPAEEYVEIDNANADEEASTDNGVPYSPDGEKVMRWVIDRNFKKDQIKLNIPEDPLKWGVAHVRHWLLWAVRQFNLTGIKLSDWKMTGTELCDMSLNTFYSKVPNDPDNTFWTHIELLRKCKIVAVKPKPSPKVKQEVVDESDPCDGDDDFKDVDEDARARMDEKVIKMGHQNTGQIQLWQFLLELLTDKNHRDAIQWLENEGEFKLINPELVAYLWGIRKNKPTMNYEKLSRALRYYYDGDMISKVHGKRFVYKFVCDLKMLLGYSANELNALVVEAELKAKQNNHFNSPLHNIFGSDYIAMLP